MKHELVVVQGLAQLRAERCWLARLGNWLAKWLAGLRASVIFSAEGCVLSAKDLRLGVCGQGFDALAYLVTAQARDEPAMKIARRRHPLAFASSYKFRRVCPKKCADAALLNVVPMDKVPHIACRDMRQNGKRIHGKA